MQQQFAMQARTALGNGNNSVRMRALGCLRNESIALDTLDLVYQVAEEISTFEAAEVRVATAGSLWDSDSDSDSNEVRRDGVLIEIELITGCYGVDPYPRIQRARYNQTRARIQISTT